MAVYVSCPILLYNVFFRIFIAFDQARAGRPFYSFHPRFTNWCTYAQCYKLNNQFLITNLETLRQIANHAYKHASLPFPLAKLAPNTVANVITSNCRKMDQYPPFPPLCPWGGGLLVLPQQNLSATPPSLLFLSPPSARHLIFHSETNPPGVTLGDGWEKNGKRMALSNAPL
jgi:hypothetical protein